MKMKIQTNRLKIGLRGLIIGLTMLVEASLHFGTYLGGNNQTASLNQTTTTVDTSLDQNECLCDTIYNACDPYCCCDTFCGADLLQIYRTSQTCQVNEIIDPLDQFKCEGFSEYFKRLSDKKYQVEGKIAIQAKNPKNQNFRPFCPFQAFISLPSALFQPFV